MSLLANLKTSDDIATEKDSVGGGGVFESGIYDFTVKQAYINISAGGATGLVLQLETETGRTLRQTLWMTSGKEKGCLNYFTDKNGEKQYLPGFNMANALCLLTIGEEIGDQETDEKVVPVYNFDSKADVPTKVPMLMALLGKPITAGVIKQVVDKNVKADDGSYVPSGETREENEIDKLFRTEDHLTVAEIRAEATEATFYDTWKAKWEGQVKQRAKGAAGTAGKPGAPGLKAAAPAGGKPAKSLFGKKG